AVDLPVTTTELLAALRERTAAGTLVLVLHEQESVGLMSLAEQLRTASEDGLEEILLVVGPEGGIAPEEHTALHETGARSVLLGPEVLRSSTAGPAALAVLSALVGRWGWEAGTAPAPPGRCSTGPGGAVGRGPRRIRRRRRGPRRASRRASRAAPRSSPPRRRALPRRRDPRGSSARWCRPHRRRRGS